MTRQRISDILGDGAIELSRGDEKYLLEIQGKPSCASNCPAGVNIKSYMNLVSDKRYEEALQVVLDANPFPGICGRVCTHPCEGECQNEADPLAIKMVKRYASDFEISRRPLNNERVPIKYDEKIAVIGAGPAGLTAAYDLTLLGYDVKVFDDSAHPGGLLKKGIPRFRLPQRIIDFELEHLKRLGVDIVSSRPITSASVLISGGFSKIVLAAGAKKDALLRIPGADSPKMVGCLDFLEKVSMGADVPVSGKVVVIGGGNSAMDAARTAKRLGADVVVAYRRTEAEMPAIKDEVEQAKAEGVEIRTLHMPKSITSEGLECIKAELGEPDESGRRRPVPIEGTEFILQADWIIPAIGQVPDIDGFTTLSFNKNGTVEVSALGGTQDPHIFAAGDVVTGPASVVEAIGSGHDAAKGVHMSLRDFEPKDEGEPSMLGIATRGDGTKSDFKIECLSGNECSSNFDEVEKGPLESEIVKEASRCNRCGSCHECTVCLTACEYKQVMAELGEKRFIIKGNAGLSRSVMENGEGWSISDDGSARPVKMSHLTAVVDNDKCIACGLCEEACAYNAVQVKLKKGGMPAAKVSHDDCRSCGACTGICPTGAIEQGAMSTQRLMEKMSSLNGDILTIKCHWNSEGDMVDEDVLEVMCTRMAGPDLVIGALSSGFKGVNIMACPGEKNCHYLPANRGAREMSMDMRDLLSITGNDANRLMHNKAWWYDREKLEKEMESLEPGNITASNTGTPLGRVLSIIGTDLDLSFLPSLEKLHSALRTYGLDVLGEVLESACIVQGHVGGHLVRPRGWKRDFHQQVQLSREALLGLEPKGSVKANIAVMEGSWIEALAKNTGADVTTIPRTSIAWPNMNQQTRKDAAALFKSIDADILLVDDLNTYCALKLITREGAWRDTPIRVIDPYTFIQRYVLDSGGEL